MRGPTSGTLRSWWKASVLLLRYGLLLLTIHMGMPAIAQAQVTLTVALNPTSPAQRQVYLELIKRFVESHPGISVLPLAFEHERYKSRAINLFEEGDALGDVMFWSGGERLRYLVRHGWLSSLEDLYATPEFSRQFSPAVVDVVSGRGQRDARLLPYAVPMSYYGWGIYYRRSVFSELGLTPPENWDELRSVIERLREAGYIPFVMGSEAPWTLAAWFDYLNLRINGLAFHQALLDGSVSLLDPRVQRVFRHWRQLLDLGAFNRNHAELSWQEALPYLYRKYGAMVLMGNFFIAQVPVSVKRDLGVLSFPQIAPDLPRYEEAPMDVAILPATSPRQAEARAFLRFLAAPAQQQYYNSRIGQISPNLLVKPVVKDFIAENHARLRNAEGLTQFFDRDTPLPYAQAGLRAFQAFTASPDRLAETLADWEQQRQRLLVEGTLRPDDQGQIAPMSEDENDNPGSPGL